MRAKYNFHKNFFSIPNSKQLDLFETLLDSDYDRLECSIKIKNSDINAARFGVFFYNKKEFSKVTVLLRKYHDELSLNTIPIINFLEKFDQYADGVFMGLDDGANYRLKIWITFKNQEAIVKEFVNNFQVNFSQFRMDYTICALDILSNNKIDPKIYSVFDCEGESNLIKHLYGEKICEMSKHSKLFGPCKRNSTSEEMLSFDLVKDLDWFVNELNNTELTRIYAQIKNEPEFLLLKNTSGLITIARSELEKGEFKHINFYY